MDLTGVLKQENLSGVQMMNRASVIKKELLKAVIGVETIIFLLTLVAVSVAQEDVTI